MNLSPAQCMELEALAIRAAKNAGAMIRSEAGRQRDVLRKEGATSLASAVVTEVDFESQRLVLEALAPSMEAFGLGLLTEESPDDGSRFRHDHFWCIDPLDGTLPFVSGSPGYSVVIALVSREGIPQIGVVYDPVTDTVYHAVRGTGAKRDGQPWELRPVPSDAALTLVMDRSFAGQPGYDRILGGVERIAREAALDGVRIFDHGGGAMNACWVAENAPAIYFKFPKTENGGGSLWDYAATACFFAELGAPTSDFHGTPLHLNPEGSTFMNRGGILYASEEGLARSVQALHRELRG